MTRIERTKKELLSMNLSDMTSSEQRVAITFALDDLVREGKLRKIWDDKAGEYRYIDSRVPQKN